MLISELDRCPFCYSANIVIRHNKDKGYYALCLCCEKGDTRAYRTYEEARDNWNQRFEPMCSIVMYEGDPSCSLCHGELDYDAKFCEWCGARVMGGDAQ